MSAERIVIVADDDGDVRDSLVTVLSSEGYETRAARNGREALLILDGLLGKPCILLLDLMMPEMDGFEVLEVLARTHRLAAVPVIVCSAAVPANRSLPAGVRQCVAKPISLDALLSGLEALCRDEPVAGERMRAGRSRVAGTG